MYLFIFIIDFVTLIIIYIVLNLFFFLILGLHDLTLEQPTIAIDESMVVSDDI